MGQLGPLTHEVLGHVKQQIYNICKLRGIVPGRSTMVAAMLIHLAPSLMWLAGAASAMPFSLLFTPGGRVLFCENDGYYDYRPSPHGRTQEGVTPKVAARGLGEVGSVTVANPSGARLS